jgi:hypothetical protein
MWNDREVWVMDTPGETRQIMRFRKDNEIVFLEWDGKHIWIATVKGLYVADTQGSLIGRIPFDDKLPNQVTGTADHSRLHLLALSPGRMLLATSYGNPQRAYIAVIEQKPEGGFESKVLHTAMRQPVYAGFVTKPDDALDVAFPLTWVVKCDDPRTHRPIILVGRSEFGAKSNRDKSGRLTSDFVESARLCRPFAIDLESLNVDLFPLSPRFVTPQKPYRSNVSIFKGALYTIYGSRVLKSEGIVREAVEFREKELLDEYRSGVDISQWLRHEDYLYSPGAQWGRLDLNSGKYELISSVPLPAHHCYGRYAVSAHYGLIAWNDQPSWRPPILYYETVNFNEFNFRHRGTLFQVRIDEKIETPADMEHVPEEYRDRHARAVQSLRELGAVVSVDDATYTVKNFSNYFGRGSPFPLPPSTIVLLTKKWEGKDRDLQRLDDLYGPLRLFVHGASFTNSSLEIVSRLPALRAIALCDVACDDDGLRHLANASRLWELELSGPTGYEFTSVGLRHVEKLPLKRVVLSGRSFDDEAVRIILKIPTLFTLSTRDDGMSDALAREVREKFRLRLTK